MKGNLSDFSCTFMEKTVRFSICRQFKRKVSPFQKLPYSNQTFHVKIEHYQCVKRIGLHISFSCPRRATQNTDESSARDKLEYNGRLSNFKTLVIKSATNVGQTFQRVSYKVNSVFLPEFATFLLFILVLSISAISI